MDRRATQAKLADSLARREHDGAVVERNCLLECVLFDRFVRRARQIRKCLVGCPTVLVVVGELLIELLQAVRVKRLDCGGDLAVECLALAAHQVAVDSLLRQLVLECVLRLRCNPALIDQRSLFELPQRLV